MGYSISWVAFKGVSHDVGLARLRLSSTAQIASFGEAKCSGHTLPGNWYLVVADGCDSQIISASSLSTLSTDCEAVAGSVEEHVMYSTAEGWCGGKRIWRTAHDAQKSIRHIECSGEPPATYAVALGEAKAQQDTEDSGAKEVDFYFEIPLQVAKSVVGFKHDEECLGIDYDRFTVIERAGSDRKHLWWKLWK
jgi:hypothetical protein